jgi:gliding motility-associated-like protein
LVDTTSHVIQTHYGGGRADGFIAHLSKNGNVLYQSTYYGSKEYDQIYFVRTDKLGNVYVFGQTDDTSGLFIKNALYNRPKSGQFISKIKPKLDTVIWSTAFGSGRGQPDISPTAFSVDVCNKTYISGWGSDFHRLYGINGAPALSTAGLDITANAFQTNNDSCDFYVMVMADDASSLAYATFMGSPTDEQHVDGGTSRFDRKGVIYQSVCAGCGGQSNFPTTLGAVSDSNWSPNCNNAVFKFDLQLPIVVSDFYGPNIGCAPFTVTFTNSSKIVLSPGYTWNFGDGGTSTASNPTHTYTQPGTYTIQLVVTDPASCNGSDTFTQQILIHAPGANDTIPPVIACYGQKVQIGIAPGNDTSYRYMWSPSATLNQSNISNPVANTLQSMTYHMLMWDGLCTDTFLQQVNIFNDSLHLLASSLLCAGDTLRLYASNSVPGQAQVYRWTPVDEIISGVNSSSPLVQPLQNTLFKVTLVDSNGCSFSDSIQISITSSLPSVRAVANPDSILYGDSSQLSLTLSANVVTYLWQNDSTLSATNILNPFADPRETRTYYVQVSDSYDCKKYDTVTVYVYHTPCSETSLYIPDAFTPNGDGKNDMLYVRGNGLSNLYFAVYDRWGQKVFETRDITVGWDGTYKGKKMDDSVFGYYAEGVCDNGEKFKKRGNVTLLK